jgi:hypothetical protein
MTKTIWLSAICLAPLIASAEQRSGDWTYDTEDDGSGSLAAGVSNSSDQLLMQLCDLDSGNCFYSVNFAIQCDKDAKYPALVNTDEGSQAIEFLCRPLERDMHMLVVTEFDAIDKLVRTGTRIGFVIPMRGDQFKAVRFSLRGATRALDSMRKAVLGLIPSGKRSGDKRATSDSEVL